ncbi:hypothetical protein ACLOJK_030336 [Asimina triloba]
MPLLFFAGSDSSSLFSSDGNRCGNTLLPSVKSWSAFQFQLMPSNWVNATKFLTGASAVGSIAIPAILKHADVIGWGALALELSSFFVFVVAIVCYLQMGKDDDYSMF